MSDEDDANRWWDSLPAKRRVQIHKYLARPENRLTIIPGQLSLIDESQDND